MTLKIHPLRRRAAKIRELQVGDVLLIPVDEQTGSLNALRGAINRLQHATDRRFKVGEHEDGTFQVERIKGRFSDRNKGPE